MADNTIESFDKAVFAYIRNCKSNEMAEGTVQNYKRVCDMFRASMLDHNHSEASVASVMDWKTDLTEKGTKITTLDSYMRMLEGFFKWSVAMELLEKNSCKPEIMPSRKSVNKASKQPYKALLGEDEFREIVTAAKAKGVPADKWSRNKAIITILLTTAIRNSELRALNLNNLDFVNGTIEIEHGKGDKHRYVAFPPIAQEAVNEYIKSGYRPKGLNMDAPLFGIGGTKKEWHEMSRVALSQLIERNIRIILGREGVRSHALRHACASIMWDKGMSLEEISELLGHESVQTTEIYAERLRPAVPSNHANELFSSIGA